MKKLVAMAMAALAAVVFADAPSVSNVKAQQRYPWNGLVDITCEVTGIDESNNDLYFVLEAVNQESASTNRLSNFWVVKDGKNSTDRNVHANGKYRLLWDAHADLGEVVCTNMVLSVTIQTHDKTHDKVQLWEGGPYWATTNIGAEEPEEYGYYFWWGDTIGYKRVGDAWVASDGSSSNFSFGSDNTPTYNKDVVTLQSEGWITADGVLAQAHDAAHVQWGGGWRMPTKDELDALNNNCDWIWTTTNGVNGYIVRGKGNYASASIFLPEAGYGYGTSLNYASSYGRYWSSVPGSDFDDSWDLYFNSSDHGTYGYAYRRSGFAVRPVQGFTEAQVTTVELAGDSEQFVLDTRTGVRESAGDEMFTYSSLWDGDADATVTIAQDGVAIAEGLTGEGTYSWSVQKAGTYVLTHTTYTNGVAGKVELATFDVPAKDIGLAQVNVDCSDVAYRGTAYEPAVQSVKFGNDTLVAGTDFTLAYSDNVDAGTATITLTGINLYNGTYTTNFTIRPRPLTQGMVGAIGNHPYTGKAQTPKPMVTDVERGVTLREDVEYTLSYANNTAIGKGIVTVTGKGNYTGSIARTFDIEPSTGSELEESLGGAGKAESDGAGGWIVTITNDVDAANLPIVIPDDLGNVTIDLNGHDLIGPEGGFVETALPVIRIVPGEGEGKPTQLTIVTSGGDAIVQGGEGAPAIEVADGAQEGVLVNIGTGVTVRGGGVPAIDGTIGENNGNLMKVEVSVPAVQGKEYTGSQLQADISATERYMVQNEGGVDVGNYPVTLTLADSVNYRWAGGDSNPTTITFMVTKATNEWITKPSIAGWTYGDAPSEPNMGTAKFGMIEVTYSGEGGGQGAARPAEAGDYTATFTVSGTDNYAGISRSVDFTIAKKRIVDKMVTLESEKYVYDGNPKTPAVTVVDGDPSIITEDDYEVFYADNISIGTNTAKVIVSGKGNYTGAVTNFFSILPPPEIRNVTAKQRWPWNGKVDITYEVVGDIAAGLPEWNTPVLVVSATNRVAGTNYVADFVAISGDSGTEEGMHHVAWDLNVQGLEFMSDDVVFTVAYNYYPNYCVVDLSAGPSASSYPVLYIADIPPGGFTDEYKTNRLVLRLIEPGIFMMGGSYEVTLTKPYYCGVFEVTQKQYELVTGSAPSRFKGETLPVERVSWNALRGYCDWPNSAYVDPLTFVGRLRARTGLNVDLPTEAQWEFACRAGSTTIYSGDCWNGYNSDDTTHPVGMRIPNAWGLYDMTGNVWEWCLNYHGSLGNGLTDPVGPSSGTKRVIRGGGVNSPPYFCNSSYRSASDLPSSSDQCRGCRLFVTLSNAIGEYKPEPVCVADSEVVAIDSRIGPRASDGDETLAYSSLWEGDADATVTIAQDGVAIAEGLTGEGEQAWGVQKAGVYTLTHTTYTNGVAGNVETATFNLTKDIASLTVGDIEQVTYTGSAFTPNPVVTDDACGYTLVKDTDYTLSYANNTAAGDATVIVTGKGNYTGTVSNTFTIVRRGIADAEITLGAGLTYNGQEQTQAISNVKVGGLNVTYTASDNKAMDPGTYTLTVTGTGNFTGTATKDFTIARKSIDGATVALAGGLTYTGLPQSQEVSAVTIGGLNATFDVSGNSATSAGTYTLTVSGTGNFTGSTAKQFTVAPKSLTSAMVGAVGNVSYTGSALTPEPVVTDAARGVTLAKGTDYTLSYANNTAAGTATVTVTGKGNYMGSIPKNFTIAKQTVVPPTIAAKEYTGQLLMADVPSSTLYDIVQPAVGIEIGQYDVKLRLVDPANYTWPNETGADLIIKFAITKAVNAWVVEPSISSWMYGQSASVPNMGEAKFGTVEVTYGAMGASRPTESGNYVATFSVAETESYTGLTKEVPFTIASAEEEKLEEAFEGLPVTIESDGEGGWIVTLTNDVDATNLPIEIPNNLGDVTIDLNGYDLIGGEGQSVIVIVPGSGDGEPTVLTVVTDGGDATMQGGEGASAIKVADGVQEGVLINIGAGVTVQGGDDFTPAIDGDVGANEGTIVEPARIHVPGEGAVTPPKSWKTGQKVTWKAAAAKGSVFARWEGELVESLGLSRNEQRNPSLQFAVPAGFDTNQISAVFISIDDDGLRELSFRDGNGQQLGDEDGILLELGKPVEFWLVDDSKSYVSATVSGLPSGLKFDAKTLKVTGAPKKHDVYWVQVKAKNASGYQWAEKVRMAVSGYTTDPKEPTLKRTAYYPLTVVSSDAAAGTVSGTGVYAEGKKASISAKPAKNHVFAGWYRDAALTKPMEFASGDYRKESQGVVIPEVRYLFAKFVEATAAGDPITGLAATGSGLVAESRFKWCVGVAVPEGDGVEYESASLPSASAAKLPAGVKFDAAKGCFTGVPTEAGTYVATVTVKNASKSTAVLGITIEVAALDAWAQGTFFGNVKCKIENGELEEESYGSATMTVAANGKISGKISLDGTNWTFKADSFSRVESGNGESAFAEATADELGMGNEGATFVVNAVATAGKANRDVELRVEDGGTVARDARPYLINAKATGESDDGEWTLALWRNVWKDKSTAAAAKTEIAKWQGVYTLSLDPGLEYGSGYLSLTVGKDGNVKATGKLADGTSASATSTLMYDEGDGWFVYLYTAPSAYNGGAFVAAVGFEGGGKSGGGHAGRVTLPCGPARWSSRNVQATGEYGVGFDREVSFVGAYYDKLEKLNEYYEALRVSFGGGFGETALPGVPAQAYSFKETYLNDLGKKVTETFPLTATAVDTLNQDGMIVSVNENGAFVVAKATKPVQDKATKEWSYEGVNDGALTLSFAQATGIFKGSYTFWYDYMSAYDDTTEKGTWAHASKKVNFEGIWVQGSDEMRGFYLWDATGYYDDPKTGKPKTYKYKESHAVILVQ